MKYLTRLAVLVLGGCVLFGTLVHSATGSAHATPVQGDAKGLTAELLDKRDEADPEIVQQLAKMGSRAAMEGLVEAYDAMGSIYMRREILLALATFDGNSEAEQPALERIMQVATESKELELRDIAVETLGSCRNLGKSFLVLIVDSPADDQTREHAMRLHVDQAEASDNEWYRKHFEPQPAADDGGGRKKRDKKKEDEEAEPELLIVRLPVLRSLAFEALSKTMEMDELEGASTDRNRDVRSIALREIYRRGDRKAEGLAEERFSRVDEHPDVRIAAAEILADMRGAKIADTFIKEGQKFATPLPLRRALADLLSAMNDEGVNKKLIRLVGKGKSHEKLFVLQAVRAIEDAKLDKSLRKLLGDKDDDVKILATQILGERKDADSIKDFEKMLKKSKSELLVSVAVGALSSIREGDPEWTEKLIEHTRGEDLLIRNAALRQLGDSGDTGHLDHIITFLDHPDWSTRLAAAESIESLRVPRGVGPIIAQMEDEIGLMRVKFAEILWRLTGQPFRKNQTAWSAWWEREGSGFEIISEAELRRRNDEEEMRRLKQTTKSTFFGIRIESHRVIFIIDVSGSMLELTRARYVNQSGAPRIDVAKAELVRAIKSLEPGSLFNIIQFSSGVEPWQDGVAESDGEGREAAFEWIERMGANGATNLYGSLEEAFKDPDVDTIFVLSDGEPTSGDIVDPGSIRERVRLWNENRGITIHCISVGGSLQVLEWIANDHGGTYVKFN